MPWEPAFTKNTENRRPPDLGTYPVLNNAPRDGVVLCRLWLEFSAMRGQNSKLSEIFGHAFEVQALLLIRAS
jgi:hypothetical protein